MSAALLIDFGSTYTKLRAIDLDQGCILGSGQGPSTVTTDVNGSSIAELRYKPWGEVRSGTTPTNYTFTGSLRLASQGLALAAGSGRAAQYSNTSDFGLMFYNARWYRAGRLPAAAAESQGAAAAHRAVL